MSMVKMLIKVVDGKISDCLPFAVSNAIGMAIIVRNYAMNADIQRPLKVSTYYFEKYKE